MTVVTLKKSISGEFTACGTTLIGGSLKNRAPCSIVVSWAEPAKHQGFHTLFAVSGFNITSLPLSSLLSLFLILKLGVRVLSWLGAMPNSGKGQWPSPTQGTHGDGVGYTVFACGANFRLLTRLQKISAPLGPVLQETSWLRTETSWVWLELSSI